MGQRSQIIIKTPSKYYNENNPNNHNGKLFVFHNQWLYGTSFVLHAARLVESLEAYSEREYFGESDIHRAIQYANVLIPGQPLSLVRSREYYTDQKQIMCYDSLEDLRDHLDNNNGFIFIEVVSPGHVEVELFNGLEDRSTVESRKPLEYVRLFYPNRESLHATHDEEDISALMQAIGYVELNSGSVYKNLSEWYDENRTIDEDEAEAKEHLEAV